MEGKRERAQEDRRIQGESIQPPRVSDQWLEERISYYEKMLGRNASTLGAGKKGWMYLTLSALRELKAKRQEGKAS